MCCVCVCVCVCESMDEERWGSESPPKEVCSASVTTSSCFSTVVEDHVTWSAKVGLGVPK